MNLKTRIWRMTHIQNLPIILAGGIHCPSAGVRNPEFVSIGFSTLVENRGKKAVKVSPGGVLNDYVPFHFHYKMPMLHKIFKHQVEDYLGTQEEIIYLVCSIEKVTNLGLSYIFTDRHAYLETAAHYNHISDLDKIKMELITDDRWMEAYSTENKEIKQAEFLVHRHFPVLGIEGIVVHNEGIAQIASQFLANSALDIRVVVRPNFYFS